MKKENVLNFQSFDYEDMTYYLPKINDVRKVLNIINKNIKSADDCNITLCKNKECHACIDEDTCNKIECKDCLLKVDSCEKYEALKEIFNENSVRLPDLVKSDLPLDNSTVSNAINCLYEIQSCIDDEYSTTDIINIRKN